MRTTIDIDKTRRGRLDLDGIDFYASEATRRLNQGPRAQRLTRVALSFW